MVVLAETELRLLSAVVCRLSVRVQFVPDLLVRDLPLVGYVLYLQLVDWVEQSSLVLTYDRQHHIFLNPLTYLRSFVCRLMLQSLLPDLELPLVGSCLGVRSELFLMKVFVLIHFLCYRMVLQTESVSLHEGRRHHLGVYWGLWSQLKLGSWESWGW